MRRPWPSFRGWLRPLADRRWRLLPWRQRPFLSRWMSRPSKPVQPVPNPPPSRRACRSAPGLPPPKLRTACRRARTCATGSTARSDIRASPGCAERPNQQAIPHRLADHGNQRSGQAGSAEMARHHTMAKRTSANQLTKFSVGLPGLCPMPYPTACAALHRWPPGCWFRAAGRQRGCRPGCLRPGAAHRPSRPMKSLQGSTSAG